MMPYYSIISTTLLLIMSWIEKCFIHMEAEFNFFFFLNCHFNTWALRITWPHVPITEWRKYELLDFIIYMIFSHTWINMFLCPDKLYLGFRWSGKWQNPTFYSTNGLVNHSNPRLFSLCLRTLLCHLNMVLNTSCCNFFSSSIGLFSMIHVLMCHMIVGVAFGNSAYPPIVSLYKFVKLNNSILFDFMNIQLLNFFLYKHIYNRWRRHLCYYAFILLH